MAKVRLDNIGRRFGDSVAIEDISFEVPDGEFWVLVGPSGCGKSTILRTIAGLEPVTTGRLYIGDTLVNRVAARQRDVAMVFQNYALYPHMSVAENLGFGLRMRGMPLSQRCDRIQTVARSLSIDHLLDRKPAQLSGGQQQRVALGRAIARQPQAFLLDEPLSNLDAQLRDETRTELKQLHQTFGITTIYVTHDQVEAMTLADNIVVLDQGKIQQIGSPQEIYNLPANRMVATFTGSPPMNLLQATFQDGFHIGDQYLPCPPYLKNQIKFSPGQPIYLGVRPEHITLSQESSEMTLRAEVVLVEPLGREILVQVKLNDSHGRSQPLMLITKMTDLQLKKSLNLQISPEQLFIFKVNTGERLFPA